MTRRTLLASAAACWAQSPPEVLWKAPERLPKAAELNSIPGIRFSVIKAHEPERDGGYGFLHGVGLAWHKDKLYASFGHNRGIENTSGEQARWRISPDGGVTWSEVRTIGAGVSLGQAVSHGSFLSHRGKLWAFLGAFEGARTGVHARAYVLREDRNQWEPRGVVVRGGFWPMQQPVRMSNGNWIMAGFRVGDGEPASVAISRGGDFRHWDHVVIPREESVGKMWGESTVIATGRQVLAIARYGDQAMALVSYSSDNGISWSPMRVSNMPMATSKPCAGTLSTGQRYLIGTTTADSGKRRAPLTIAVSRKGELLFSKIFLIRNAEHGFGDSHPRASLSYPYAVEHAGHLYVGYSNNGGRPGMNINSAELAVIPVAALSA